MTLEGFTVRRLYCPENETRNALNAAEAPECTRKMMAGCYADCIRAEHPDKSCDWPAINAAILKRWPKSLEWIKRQAWKDVQAWPRTD